MYGQTVLPRPDSGRYMRFAARAFEATDDGFACGLAGALVGIAGAVAVPSFLAAGHPWWALLGAAVLVAGLLLFAAPFAAANRGTVVADHIRCKGDGRYDYEGSLAPAATWRSYREIHERHLREAAAPLWLAFLAAMAAYAADEDRRHADAAYERQERILALSKLQGELDAARSLTRAGGGVETREDLDRADALLAALKELDS